MTNKGLAILGLVLSFFVSLAGVIISAVALNKFKESGETDGKGIAIAGLIVGIVFMAISVLSVVCTVCLGGIAMMGS